jgi:hypothetical protein
MDHLAVIGSEALGILAALFLLQLARRRRSGAPPGATPDHPHPDTPKKRKRLSLEELRFLAQRAGFGADAPYAAALAMRESGGDPGAVNDTRGRTDLPPGVTNELSVGLWQINVLASPQYGVEWLKVPENNAKAAHDLYSKFGFRPWRLPGEA